MTGKEYIRKLDALEINNSKAKKVIAKYADGLPEVVLKIISDSNTPVFLGDDSRIMSIEEIIDAEKDLHVSFKKKAMIPIVDCGNNDFIVYHYYDHIWSMFNIVDEVIFKKKKSFEELLK